METKFITIDLITEKIATIFYTYVIQHENNSNLLKENISGINCSIFPENRV